MSNLPPEQMTARVAQSELPSSDGLRARRYAARVDARAESVVFGVQSHDFWHRQDDAVAPQLDSEAPGRPRVPGAAVVSGWRQADRRRKAVKHGDSSKDLHAAASRDEYDGRTDAVVQDQAGDVEARGSRDADAGRRDAADAGCGAQGAGSDRQSQERLVERAPRQSLDAQTAPAATRPDKEPIYADPYTRITWLHEEIERLRRVVALLLESQVKLYRG